MKNAAILLLFSAFVLFGCATNATDAGTGIHSAGQASRPVVAREWKGRVAPARADDELPDRVLHYDVTYTDLERVRLRE